jgi:hypothetical protein
MAWVLSSRNFEEPSGYLTGGGWPQRGANGAKNGALSEWFQPGLVFCDSCAFLRLNQQDVFFVEKASALAIFLCHLVFFVANGLGVTR